MTKFDIIEFTPREDIFDLFQGEKVLRGMVECVNSDGCSMSIEWFGEHKNIPSSWWGIEDSRFKKLGNAAEDYTND